MGRAIAPPFFVLRLRPRMYLVAGADARIRSPCIYAMLLQKAFALMGGWVGADPQAPYAKAPKGKLHNS